MGDLTNYNWRYAYYSSSLNENGEPTDILHDFYLPALERIVKYDRVAGYFRSSSLAAASQGYTAFLKHGGQMRLIVGADLQLQDVAAILAGNNQRLSDRLMKELDGPEQWTDEVRNGVALLSAMVASSQLEIKVAIRCHGKTGEPLVVDSTEDGYVHEKWFVMTDDQGHRLHGGGSLNESRTALSLNAENIDVHCDWMGGTDLYRVNDAETRFELLWDNHNPYMKVLPIPEAVKERLIKLKSLRETPTEVDGTVIQEEVTPTLEELLRFAVLRDAPKMPGGVYLGMYTAPVEPWSHQEIVSRKLVESWPYSYMMCDEVGLGKTIESALAIRSLVLSGRVDRVLIVAPASLTDQWHRELAQKAMLPFSISRAAGKKITHTNIFPYESKREDSTLYSPRLNIVSSGILSRKERLSDLNSMEKCDIILIDEAHYARRQNPREANAAPKFGNLYRVIQNNVRLKARSLWMATATPMQIAPIEVYDLFKLTNRVGEFQSDPILSLSYFELMGAILHGDTLSRQQWAMLGQSFAQIEALDPYLWEQIQKTTVNAKNRKALSNMPSTDPKRADMKYLSQPLFSASPLSRVMMRHTRSLLEIYRKNGELKSNLATRHVRPVCAIEFTPAEQKFYDMLEEYCAELNRQVQQNNPNTRQVMNFLLNFLQLRFASSIYAIGQTLSRRAKRVEKTLLMGARTFESQDDLDEALEELYQTDDTYSEGDLDDITLDALLKDRSKEDLEWEKEKLAAMLDELSRIHETPSKIRTLLEELDARRLPNGRIRQTVLFTRFYDSLHSIREYLSIRDANMRVGVYAGGKAFWYDTQSHKDVSVTHEEIKRLFRAGEIDLLLCTDAAAEGLNLQCADMLINFDMGWNPMKIEQRIGRIDRIGQEHNDIYVLNMCYLGSTEEIVYGRLLERLQQANLVVGAQQISLLPVEPDEFRQLHDHKITLDELEKSSIEKLKQQKADHASMEMSAEDMYLMYRRISEQMKQQKYPAGLESLWDALTSSDYLKSLGGTVQQDGSWLLPSNSFFDSIHGTIDREVDEAGITFLTWGNPSVDRLLDAMAEQIPEDEPSPVKRISIKENGIEIVGYAVATMYGIRLITSYEQLHGVQINEAGVVTESDIQRLKKDLHTLAKNDLDQVREAEKAEQRNKEYAKLHERFLNHLAIGILKERLQFGDLKISEAIKALETNPKLRLNIKLPYDEFVGKESLLLFQIYSIAGEITAPVSGLLLECVLALIKRTQSRIRKKKSEIETTDVIRLLEGK